MITTPTIGSGPAKRNPLGTTGIDDGNHKRNQRHGESDSPPASRPILPVTQEGLELEARHHNRSSNPVTLAPTMTVARLIPEPTTPGSLPAGPDRPSSDSVNLHPGTLEGLGDALLQHTTISAASQGVRMRTYRDTLLTLATRLGSWPMQMTIGPPPGILGDPMGVTLFSSTLTSSRPSSTWNFYQPSSPMMITYMQPPFGLIHSMSKHGVTKPAKKYQLPVTKMLPPRPSMSGPRYNNRHKGTERPFLLH